MKSLNVTQIRSGIGFDKKQTLALRGLGIRKMNHSVDVIDTPSVRGLILKVRHLVAVIDNGPNGSGKAVTVKGKGNKGKEAS